ncbi:hypothetical protein [Paraburkholderia bannensis]|uniref:hypothetical protein n=1 Tax=Paraburkholderia bannensis TaxID=765414 RepID=UPI002AB6E8F6|nr:hypothetical protein [Paraburkholderia bannensis]
MRRFAALLLFGGAGFLVGMVLTSSLLAFSPVCGYYCGNHDAGVAIVSTLGSTLLFLLAGYFLTRTPRLSRSRALLISGTLSLAGLLIASLLYVCALTHRYRDAESARPVTPDIDFMYMAIATREVQAYTKSDGGTPKPAGMISQWKRCTIAGAWCNKRPYQAYMRCKDGIRYVNEPDWNAFALIPHENFPGAVPMKSMRLCEPGNVPEDP